MDNTMTVEAIENGTVIDHIPAGLGLAILRHFKLDESGNRITVGFNLKGKRGNKDLIKIQNIRFDEKEAAQIALFAPTATVNVIENFEVAQKIKPIRGGTDGAQHSFKGLPCPNIFAGGINFHGPYEFVPVQSMEKAMQVIVKLCELTAQYNK
ncbi:MAG: aspartate carbamoyltransferase regulatory subunit [Neisseriaceae bacterium]|nr:aspartate carbamoyltransferase regulatory subunit [Neisseriaceae bacterium]